MTIKLYNTMSRKLSVFKPIKPGAVSFYSCGPTVYHLAHIGNLRAFILADMLKRMFVENKYNVTNVMNITDVGHLTNDEDDTGEDKMEKGANRENKSVWEIAQFYTDGFLRDISDLNILPPTYMPRATEYIPQQIELVQKLEALGYTYEIPDDGIYYDTSKFANYGALTGGCMCGNHAGARVSFNDLKRNPGDFALWKFSPKSGAKRAMEWESPWGVGFPGWHIECSAMSMALLGPHFDIHTGGIDLSRIHHSNEIAQSEPITGKPWVNYWVHNEFLVDKSGDKMSKSAGEFLALAVLKDRGFDPMAYRYFLLLGHYQSQIAFSWESLDAAATGYKNIVRKITDLFPSKGGVAGTAGEGSKDTDVFKKWHDKILAVVSDNLKTAEGLVLVQDLLRDADVNAATKIAILEFVDRLLGLQFIDRAQKLRELESIAAPADIQKLADDRDAAKAAKNWALADEIRAQIDAAGWAIVDTRGGIKLIKK